ncbi:hypothetical protein PENSPDRAFT_655201 [Peniophora sp. CONT]|nr:hypothetical protein PENSPDRAFT_655201 [Peniophora sp. CONT]
MRAPVLGPASATLHISMPQSTDIFSHRNERRAKFGSSPHVKNDCSNGSARFYRVHRSVGVDPDSVRRGVCGAACSDRA